MMRSLIINGDDFGLANSISSAIVSGIEEGWLSSTSVMVCVDNAESRVRSISHKISHCAGVHLTLTFGHPCLPRSVVPSLYGQKDFFLPLSQVEKMNPVEIEIEWEAQIQRAKEWGLKPTHLDSHHAVHLRPHILDVYLSLACKHKLPVRGDSGVVIEKMKSFKVSGSTSIIRNWSGTGGNVKKLLQEIDLKLINSDLQETIEVVCHPAFADSELRRISSLNDARTADVVGLRQLINSGELSKRQMELRSFATSFG